MIRHRNIFVDLSYILYNFSNLYVNWPEHTNFNASTDSEIGKYITLNLGKNKLNVGQYLLCCLVLALLLQRIYNESECYEPILHYVIDQYNMLTSNNYIIHRRYATWFKSGGNAFFIDKFLDQEPINYLETIGNTAKFGVEEYRQLEIRSETYLNGRGRGRHLPAFSKEHKRRRKMVEDLIHNVVYNIIPLDLLGMVF